MNIEDKTIRNLKTATSTTDIFLEVEKFAKVLGFEAVADEITRSRQKFITGPESLGTADPRSQ